MIAASSNQERSKSAGSVASKPSVQIGMSIRMQFTATRPARSCASDSVSPSSASFVAV
jgi:hypothetical protein